MVTRDGEVIAELFDEQDGEVITPRHNDTYLGKIRLPDGGTLDVAATSSGMGPGSTEIIAVELLKAGARRLIRVGTSGAVLAEFDSSVLAHLFVADADPVSLLVIDERAVFSKGKGAPLEFDGCPDIQQGGVLKEKTAVVVRYR